MGCPERLSFHHPCKFLECNGIKPYAAYYNLIVEPSWSRRLE